MAQDVSITLLQLNVWALIFKFVVMVKKLLPLPPKLRILQKFRNFHKSCLKSFIIVCYNVLILSYTQTRPTRMFGVPKMHSVVVTMCCTRLTLDLKNHRKSQNQNKSFKLVLVWKLLMWGVYKCPLKQFLEWNISR